METIRSSADVTRVFKQGKRFGRGPGMLIVLEKEQHGEPGRVAFVAGKKLGNAVWRNRAKRRMRAACRELGGPWDGHDIVFIAGRRTNEVPFAKMVRGYRETIRSIGLKAD